MRKKIYNLNYENGRCPLGYEYVESHYSAGTHVRAYCRKFRNRKYEKIDDGIARDAEEMQREIYGG